MSTEQVTTAKLGTPPDSITCPAPVITESPAITCTKTPKFTVLTSSLQHAVTCAYGSELRGVIDALHKQLKNYSSSGGS